MSVDKKAPAQARVMHLFLTGRGFTTRELTRLADVSDPRKVIQILRDKGVHISDQWEQNREKIRYKRYYITPEDIEFATQWRILHRKR